MGGGVVPAPAGLGRTEWVLSRPLYRFGRFEMKSVPRAQREQALRLQIRQWCAFVAADHYIAWHGEDALVWAWDADKLGSSIREAGLLPARVRVVPESLLRRVHDHGVHLHACLDGCEGQLWRDGSLAASRWWAHAPDSLEWLRFQRDSGIALEEQRRDVPVPLSMDWRAQPWAPRNATGNAPGSARNREMIAVAVAGTMLAAAAMWYGLNWLKFGQANAGLAQQLQGLEREAEPIRLARSSALTALERIKSLRSLNAYPDHLSVMASVSEILARNGATLRQWDYHGGKLKIAIASPDRIGNSDQVKSLQASGVFEGVQTVPTTDPNVLALTMDVVPNAQIRFNDDKAGPVAK